ncbi:NF-X1-type zinc finger protein NFXL1-like [Clavelina lepadiformis]|uniref:NF-X1-type zinc finger protein NFXL1 n=1 Tax=Clavelina lepadiformis TaxID=159417 RepID=A0ABP0FZ64_CLALP
MEKAWQKRGRGRGTQRSQKGISQKPLSRGRGTASSVPGGLRGHDQLSAELRFRDTSEQHEKNAKKILQSFEDCYQSSSEEEDIDDTNILSQLTKSYKGSHPTQANITNGDYNHDETHLGITTQYLTECCQSGAITCLVCISTVKRQNETWSCEKCFAIFHLKCIKQWVLQGVAQATLLSDEYFPNKDLPWYCPKCRNEYPKSKCPDGYYCFCGAEKNPSPDPWLLPHSCGNTCNKLLKNPPCGHHCLLLCHPGPCPPCPQTVQLRCHCGKQKPASRRCGSGKWSCGKICGKLLSCNKHKCESVCHSDECTPCTQTSIQDCTCGAEKQTRPCSEPHWNCGKVCDKLLSCGFHKCEKSCHAPGQCYECPRSGVRACPCGKTNFHNLKCTEKVTLCEHTCGKSLGCFSNHKCSRRCHFGPCGSCPLMAVKTCRCGKRERELPCQKVYICETKCQKMRSCGRHHCKRKCCTGNCPPCEQICGHTLQCKKHKCQMLCHQGPCYPCPLTSKVSCTCGETYIMVVCGKEKTTKPPRCRKKCKSPSDCHHAKRIPHSCHFGDCPKCTQVCNQTLPCGHLCPSQCHDNVVVRNETRAPAPWELPQLTYIIKKLPCPPCKVPVSVVCRGKHDTSDFPCSEAREYSCGRKCGRQLTCSNHLCELECHPVGEDEALASSCAPCERPCSKPRPEGCAHDCISVCHPDMCPPCRKRIRMKCHCGMVSLKHLCCEWAGRSQEECDRMASCGNHCPKLLSPCEHLCPLQCHPGQCPPSTECSKKITVRCPCKRRKKESVCSYIHLENFKLQCDDECMKVKAAKRAEKEEAEQRKRDEEARKQLEEVEKFERKMNRRSRLRKRSQSADEKDAENGWKRFLSSRLCQILHYIFVASVVLASIAYAYYLSNI